MIAGSPPEKGGTAARPALKFPAVLPFPFFRGKGPGLLGNWGASGARELRLAMAEPKTKT